jgi:hypothetical protein
VDFLRMRSAGLRHDKPRCLSVSPGDSKRLQALVENRNAPRSRVWRARIVLMSAEGVGTNAIVRETQGQDLCLAMVGAFCIRGPRSLLRDKSRPSRIPKLDPLIAERVVSLAIKS